MNCFLEKLLFLIMAVCSGGAVTAKESRPNLIQAFQYGDIEFRIVVNNQKEDCPIIDSKEPVIELAECYTQSIDDNRLFWGTYRKTKEGIADSGIYYFKNGKPVQLLDSKFSYLFKLKEYVYAISIVEGIHKVHTQVDRIVVENHKPILKTLKVFEQPMLAYYEVPDGIVISGMKHMKNIGWAVYFNGVDFRELNPIETLTSEK